MIKKPIGLEDRLKLEHYLSEVFGSEFAQKIMMYADQYIDGTFLFNEVKHSTRANASVKFNQEYAEIIGKLMELEDFLFVKFPEIPLDPVHRFQIIAALQNTLNIGMGMEDPAKKMASLKKNYRRDVGSQNGGRKRVAQKISWHEEAIALYKAIKLENPSWNQEKIAEEVKWGVKGKSEPPSTRAIIDAYRKSRES